MATAPRQFRLAETTMKDLELIRAHLTQSTGRDASRADAIRAAAREYVRRHGLAEGPGKKSR